VTIVWLNQQLRTDLSSFSTVQGSSRDSDPSPQDTLPGVGQADSGIKTNGILTSLQVGETQLINKPLQSVPPENIRVGNLTLVEAGSSTVDPPGAAALQVTKSVGLNPATCAVTKQISLPAVGDATYCYLITNTGTTTLISHTVIDDKLGTLLLDFPYVLPPQAAAYFTITATIFQDTINTAQWTASDGQFSPPDSDTATVNLLISLYLPFIRR
jgi:hypothetical protein